MRTKRKYADGGKVLAEEYGAGKPTFGKAVAARLGFGDGYGKAKGKAVANYKPVSEKGKALQNTLSERQKMLNEYKDGGKVKKRGC